VVLTAIISGVSIAFLVFALSYVWRTRPYRGEGAEDDNAWRDEMALQADKFTNRSHSMGADIGDDI